MSDIGNAVQSARTLLKDLPRWIRVVAFAALAVVSAMAGTLDDWVRIILAVLFAAVSLSLAAEVVQGYHDRHPQEPPDDAS